MCGHVGVAGDTSGKIKKVFEEMLLADQIRGPHSTGIMVGRRYAKDVDVVRSVGPTPVLMGQKAYDKAMTQISNCIIGHNRYATLGEITWNNAHPFDFPDICGAHNGTLDYSSKRAMYKHDEFGTDSEAIFSNIQKYGIDETFEELDGAWALVWYDKQKKSINFLRNDKRELFYTFVKGRKTIIWASEAGLIRWITSRNGVELEDGKILAFNEDVHYTWNIPEKTEQEFTEVTRRKLERKKPSRSFQYGRGHGAWTYGYGDYSSYKPRERQQNVLPFVPNRAIAPPAHVNTKKFRPPYKDHTSRIIKKPEFLNLIKTGCVFCDETNIQWGDYVHFLKPDIDGRRLFLCEECYNEEEVRIVCKDLMHAY